MPKLKIIGQQIREVREEAGFTQHQLVAKINCRRPDDAPQFKQGHLSAMENDHHVPTLTLLSEIARATGCRLCDRVFVRESSK